MNSLQSQNTRNPYFGFWASVGIAFLVFLIFSILQAIFIFAYSFYLNNWDIEKLIHSLEAMIIDGDAMGVAEIPSAIIGTILVVVFSASKGIISVKDYLLLNPIKLLDILKWLAVMVLVIITMELVNIGLDREVPDFMNDVYESTDNFILLWIAVIIGAPIFEEFLFRGFLFEGLRHSNVGLIGAVLITASSWAIIHVQYGWFEIVTIFLIGIILAIAKYKTKSLYIPIAMHMLMNFTASVMMELPTE